MNVIEEIFTYYTGLKIKKARKMSPPCFGKFRKKKALFPRI